MSLRLIRPLPLVHVLQMGETEPQWICQKQEDQGRGKWCHGCPACLLDHRALGLVTFIVTAHRSQVTAGRRLTGPW